MVLRIVPSRPPEKCNRLFPNSSSPGSLSIVGIFGTVKTLDIWARNEATWALIKGQQKVSLQTHFQ